jgi:hypothetical protein
MFMEDVEMRKMRFVLAIACAMLCGLPLFAAAITISNTGLIQPDSSVDPNWKIFGTGNAIVTTGSPANTFPFDAGATNTWLADNATSRWISPQGTYVFGQTNDGIGGWPYSTTFSLTGLNPATARIDGQFIADNQLLGIYINGLLVALPVGGYPLNNFQAWTPFSITSGFVTNTNTLQFVVNNTGGPVGLRVELSGTADPVGGGQIPEPTTFVLLGAGLLGLGLLRRRTNPAA